MRVFGVYLNFPVIWGVGVAIIGYGQSKSFVYGAEWNISFFLWLIFAVRINTEEELNNLETVVSMLSCVVLERSNNPYIEFVVESCCF